MTILIFNDSDFQAIAEYHAADVSKALKADNIKHEFINHKQLEMLYRSMCDILILPYKSGNFSDNAFRALVNFHANGGSLLILGDIPHYDKWYPYRNSLAFELHLTCSNGRGTIKGLTDAGKAILGDISDLDKVIGHDFTSVRIGGFPDDITHSLIQQRSDDWDFCFVPAIERKSGKFIGARFAAIGINGGEPRENAAGGYQLPWTYNPGILNRNWSGIHDITRKLVNWLKPVDIAGALQFKRVRKINDSQAYTLTLNSPAQKDITADVFVKNISTDQVIFSQNVKITNSEKLSLAFTAPDRLGKNTYQLSVIIDGKQEILHETTEYVLEHFEEDCLGSSTYYAFKTPDVTEEYKTFVRQLLARGNQYIRANIPWEDIEPKPGCYNWAITDQLLEFAEQENIKLYFWMFPTTYGSGLSDAGIPLWTLKEPAIDRHGNKGFFPSLWSPFYRNSYFNMLKEFSKRYADNKSLDRFIIDFGNSDFSYGYYYYVNDTTLFDYSPFERQAFADYLKTIKKMSLNDINNLYKHPITSWDQVPVPYVEQTAAWLVYLDFRSWSLHSGVKEAVQVIMDNAPDKVPPDFPGHGLGSIADLGTAHYDVKKRHFQEEKAYPTLHTELHSAGHRWGGEAWQVGGGYTEYDSALFGATRFNASYFSIPGPDLFSPGEDLAKTAYIRHALAGAEKPQANIAVLGKGMWHDLTALPNIAMRMDYNVDYLHKQTRFDFSKDYKLFILPSEIAFTNGPNQKGSLLLPGDENYYDLLADCVKKGMNLLLFASCFKHTGSKAVKTYIKDKLGLEDLSIGARAQRTVTIPDNAFTGKAYSITNHESDKQLLLDEHNECILLQHKLGKGSVFIAGYDDFDDSFDGEIKFNQAATFSKHTLTWLTDYIGIKPSHIRSNHAAIAKDLLRRGNEEFLVLFNDQDNDKKLHLDVKLQLPANQAFELANNECVDLKQGKNEWQQLTVIIPPKTGRYFKFIKG